MLERGEEGLYGSLPDEQGEGSLATGASKPHEGSLGWRRPIQSSLLFLT